MLNGRIYVWVFLVLLTLLAGCGGESDVEITDNNVNSQDSVNDGIILLEREINEPLNPQDLSSDYSGILFSGVINIYLERNTDSGYINTILEKYNARVVSSIEISNNYRIILNDEKTETEFNQIIDEINEDTNVFVAVKHMLMEGDYVEIEDPWEENNITWDDDNPDGNNWGVEKTKILSAWSYNSILNKNVSIGVVDAGIYKHNDHSDIRVVTDSEYSNNSETKEHQFNNHGTHVFGTIGATWNNVGITGIVRNGKYSFSSFRNLTGNFLHDILIARPTVINQSAGHNVPDGEDSWFASFLPNTLDKIKNNDIDSINEFKKDVSVHRKKRIVDMISSGFTNPENKVIVVQSSGNQDIDVFYHRGFESVKYTDDSDSDYIANKINTLSDHVVIVGSVNENARRSVFSNYGDLVDIYAPGENILSTTMGSDNDHEYTKLGGTSMASPHIAGVLGLIYGANPDLEAAQAKYILLKGAELGGIEVSDTKATENKYVANAKKSVELALYSNGISKSTYLAHFVEPYEYYVNGEIDADINPMDMTLSGKITLDQNEYQFTGEFELKDKDDSECDSESCIIGKNFKVSNESVSYDVLKRVYIDLDEPYTQGDSLPFKGNGSINQTDFTFPSEISVPNSPIQNTPTPGDQKVNVSWSQPAGGTVTGYNVYRKTNETEFSKIANNINTITTSYEDQNVSNDTTYYYVVTASNGGYEGKRSNEESAVPQKFPAPTIDSPLDNVSSI